MLRVVARKRVHDEFDTVPLGAQHVRQRLEAQRLASQHQFALAAFRDVVFIDVKGEFRHRALRSRHVRFDIHRIHVFVFGKR